MTDQLLLDFERAFDLHVTMNGVADEIDGDRRSIAGLLADTERFIHAPDPDADRHLRHLADLLRAEADDLARRLRMVALGGPEINAGLFALEQIRDAWHLIDNKGDLHGPNSHDRDGVVSRSDLEWAAQHLDPTIATAARWLLEHDEFFTAVETANNNSNYLANGGAGFAADAGETDSKLNLDDVNAYLTKLDTWATLVPYMATIDIAAHGGDLDGVMSKNDFEAFLDDQTLPPHVRAAAQNVLDDSAYHDTGGIGWDDVLIVASFIPIVGDFIDAASALYYLAQGDWEQAALSSIGLIPIPGMTGGTARGAKAAAEELGEEFLEEGLETVAQRSARDSIDDAARGATDTTFKPGDPMFSRSGHVTNADALRDGTPIPFTRESVDEFAERAGVGIDDVRVQLLDTSDEIGYLDFNDGVAFASDGTIFIGPAAFADEELLVRTLAHERTHLYQQQVWPDPRGLIERFEDAAYGIEDTFVTYYRRGEG